MIPLSLRDVAAATGGRLHGTDGSPMITGSVEFDSRDVTPGGLFVALPGERVDGHEFAAAAVAAGAVGVLGARPLGVPTVVAPAPDAEGGSGAGAAQSSYVLAADRDGAGSAVLGALARLARTVLDRRPELMVVGITGSSGKTSTKDMVAALLGPLGPSVAPPGSFNNELGHPWTALRVDERTRHLVLELSARGAGHIEALCEIAPPQVGMVLNVGSAHLGEFGSREAIAAAKGELIAAVPPDGLAILNADDPAVTAMSCRTAARVVRFGRAEDADVRAVDVRSDERGCPSFRLLCPAGEAAVQLSVHGGHQVGNALAAAAVALHAGASVESIAQGLAGYRPASRWRMEVSESADGVTVINDAYNANPESMRAAIEAAVAMTGGRRRGWAVLGPIGELGAESAAEHAELGRLVARSGLRRLVVVGEEAAAMYHTALAETPDDGEAPVLVADHAAAVELLDEQLEPGDVVLVKASRAYGLERIAEGVLAERSAR